TTLECAARAEFPRNLPRPPTFRRNAPERLAAPLPMPQFLPALHLHARCSSPMPVRCFAAAPIPPALPPLLSSLANADSALRILRRLSAPARLAQADRAAAWRCAAALPGNICAEDIRAPGIRRNPPLTDNNCARNGRPSRCKAPQLPAGNRALPARAA